MNEQGKRFIQISFAVLINVAAGVIVFFITKNYTYTITVIAVLELIGIVAILIFKLRPNSLIGELKEYRSLNEGPTLFDLVKDVTSEFKYMGISARTVLIDDEYIKEMIQKAKGNCVFKFLILDPECSFVEEKAIEEGDTCSGWKKEIEATISRLKKLREKHDLKIEVRTHDTYPIFRMIIINSNNLFFSWYPVGRRGSNSPLSVFSNSRNSMYEPLTGYFDKLWISCKEH